MDCILCTTPFQVLSAIGIAMESMDPIDLYIVLQFSNAQELAKRIEASGVFHSVSCIEENSLKEQYIHGKKGILGRLMLAKAYLSADIIARQILIPGADYSRMYTSNKEFICRMVYLHLARRKKGVTLVAFEDGEGTYASPRTYLPGKADRLVRKLLFHGRARGIPEELMVYLPELYRDLNPNSTLPIKQIPNHLRDTNFLYYINSIFGYDQSASISEPVILIDTVKEEVLFQKGQREVLDAIYEKVFQSIPADQLVIKRHPRDRSAETAGRSYYRANGIPFECICMNESMENKVLIALSSTAVIQPKILSGQEPVVILLNRLVKTNALNREERISFFEIVGKIYSNRNRFFMPKNMDELQEALLYAAAFIKENEYEKEQTNSKP